MMVVVAFHVVVMPAAPVVHGGHPAVILVSRRARRVVVRKGGRDGNGEEGRGRRGDQKTVHSLILWLDVTSTRGPLSRGQGQGLRPAPATATAKRHQR